MALWQRIFTYWIDFTHSDASVAAFYRQLKSRMGQECATN